MAQCDIQVEEYSLTNKDLNLRRDAGSGPQISKAWHKVGAKKITLITQVEQVRYVGKPNKKDLEKKQEKSNLNTQELEENGI